MNKSLLIIICDFLLISILAMVEFEPADAATDAVDPAAVNQAASRDMLELLELSLEHAAQQSQALEAERSQLASERDQLAQSLDSTTNTLAQTQSELELTAAQRADLARKSAALEQSLATTNQSLELTEAQRRQLQRDLEAEAQRRAQLQAELKAQQDALAQRQADLQAAQDNLAQLEATKAQLSTELKVRDTEVNILEQNLIAARAEVERARIDAERAQSQADQLAKGVNQLAASSSAIKDEISRAQPVSLNAIYRQFELNRALLTIQWSERQLFGTTSRSTVRQSPVINSEFGPLILFSTEGTPLAQQASTASDFAISLSINNRSFAVQSIQFPPNARDFAAIPIPPELIADLNLQPFNLTDDPLRFPDAVLVASDRPGYGEIAIRIPPNAPDFLDVEDRFFKRLFGEFSPATGDFVFAKSGDLMGIMTSKNRARLVNKLSLTPLQPLESTLP